MELTPEQLRFIERLTNSLERVGAAPMLGRVYGAIMASERDMLSADELATLLQASRGSISQATRQLIEIRMIERVRKPGDRKDYFRIGSDAWPVVTRLRTMESLRIKELFQHALRDLPNTNPAARESMEATIEFITFWEEHLDRFFKDWDEYKEQRRAQRDSSD